MPTYKRRGHPFHPAPFRVEDEPRISIEAVWRIVRDANAESDFNDERFHVLKSDLEGVQYQHHHYQCAAKLKNKPGDLKGRSEKIRIAAHKLRHLFDDDAGQAISENWFWLFRARDATGEPIIRPEGLNKLLERPPKSDQHKLAEDAPEPDQPELPEGLPELDQIKVGLDYLEKVADINAKIYANIEMHSQPGGWDVVKLMVQEYLEPLYRKHFNREPEHNDVSDGKFPHVASEICKELRIFTSRGKHPPRETIRKYMTPRKKRHLDNFFRERSKENYRGLSLVIRDFVVLIRAL